MIPNQEIKEINNWCLSAPHPDEYCHDKPSSLTMYINKGGDLTQDWGKQNIGQHCSGRRPTVVGLPTVFIYLMMKWFCNNTGAETRMFWDN